MKLAALISGIFFLYFNILSMEDEHLRKRNVLTLKDVEENIYGDNRFSNKFSFFSGSSVSKNINNELEEVIVGNFEDRQNIGKKSLTSLVFYETFPEEIWFEIISYLDFNDPALVYFFAPRLGVAEAQAEKMAESINNYVLNYTVKNAHKFEDIDIKLKSILKTYSKQARELLEKNLKKINNDFDIKKVKLSSSLGRFPIKWLLRCPKEIDDDFESLIKDQNKLISNKASYESMSKHYFKLKKTKLLYESFNFHKYKKALNWLNSHKNIVAVIWVLLNVLGLYFLLQGKLILGFSILIFAYRELYFLLVIDDHATLIHSFRKFLYRFKSFDDIMKFQATLKSKK